MKIPFGVHSILVLLFVSCQSQMILPTSIDIQGHRGMRGTYPENTLEGFKRALKAGVSTLEMDLVITADSQVLVSHEPFFSHEISTDPSGLSISESEEKSHNIFRLSYASTKQYDVGWKEHLRFPKQIKAHETKPLLKDVFQEIELFCERNSIQPPYYNIEIKRKPEGDSIFHPKPKVFADLVMEVVSSKKLQKRVILQCFDVETLQIMHRNYPQIALTLLIENLRSPEKNIKNLGFTPRIYSPNYKLVNTHLRKFCTDKNMLLIPWTVNDISGVEKMLSFQVDGIITDFPIEVVAHMTDLGVDIRVPKLLE